jgi:peptidoglycan/LPS O-acetylase OafA/YrhL
VVRKSETFTALNGLRFLAALAIVIFHYAPRVGGYARLPEILKNLIDEGPAAIGFFFILSGFVLAHRHLNGAPRVQAPDFYWARFARLYPAYLLAFLLFLPVALQRYVVNPLPGSAGRHTFVLSAVLSCLMLQSWTPLAQAWNGPSWSLSVEAFMYLLFPFIGYRLSTLRRRNSVFIMLLAWLIPSSLAVAYVARWIPGDTWRLYVTNNPLLWLPLFVMGICASRMVTDWRKVPERTANALSTAAFVALILCALAWPHKWADVFVTGGIVPLLAVVILFFTRSQGWIARTVGSPLFSKLGEASYAVYILQAPLWHYWQEITNSLRGAPAQTGVAALWQFLLFVPLLVLASMAVQRYLEVPARAWLGGLKKKGALQQTVGTIERPVLQPTPIQLQGD